MPLTMDGGAVLRAGVVYSTDSETGERGEGRFPGVIEVTPYAFGPGVAASPSPFLTRYGYISVVVRPGGRAGSTGDVQQCASRDGRAGKVAAAWAARRLAESDGRVAVIGCSSPGAVLAPGRWVLSEACERFAAWHALTAIAGLGVRLAIEDCGTRYSSLRYLQLLAATCSVSQSTRSRSRRA